MAYNCTVTTPNVLAQSAWLECISHITAWFFLYTVWHFHMHGVSAYPVHSTVITFSLHMPWYQSLTFKLSSMLCTLTQKVSDMFF